MKRLRTIALIAAIALVVAGIWFARSRSEPVYRGKPISYWIEPFLHDGEVTKEAVDSAFADMDARAVRWLVRALEPRPAPLESPVRRFFGHMGFEVEKWPVSRLRVVCALARLGEKSTSALPALRHHVANPTGRDGNELGVMAVAAMAIIERGSVQRLLDNLSVEAPLTNRIFSEFCLEAAGDSSMRLVPALLSHLHPGETASMRIAALVALKAIGRSPDLCVPRIADCLRHPEALVKVAALDALARFGNQAEPTVESVRELTKHPAPEVSLAAMNALIEIQHSLNDP